MIISDPRDTSRVTCSGIARLTRRRRPDGRPSQFPQARDAQPHGHAAPSASRLPGTFRGDPQHPRPCPARRGREPGSSAGNPASPAARGALRVTDVTCVIAISYARLCENTNGRCERAMIATQLKRAALAESRCKAPPKLALRSTRWPTRPRRELGLAETVHVCLIVRLAYNGRVDHLLWRHEESLDVAPCGRERAHLVCARLRI